MAAIGNKYLSMIDWAKRKDPDGTTADIAEVMSVSSPLIDDMIWTEGNLPTGHRSTIRTGLPTGTWRQLYKGVPQEKSTTAQIDDQCGNLQGYSDVDADEADLNGATTEYLMSEEDAFIEGLTQTATTALLYGNGTASPEKITGIMPRFSTISGAGTAVNIIDAGGTGTNNCSILLIGHGKKSVFGIFPKGSKAGLQRDPKGQVTVYDASNNPYEAYRSHYLFKLGLVLKDWRYIARACNIDVPALAGATPASIARLFTRLIARLPSSYGRQATNTALGVKPIFYVPRVLWSWAATQAQEKVNMGFQSTKDAQGGPIVDFWGYPIKILDEMLTTEARVV